MSKPLGPSQGTFFTSLFPNLPMASNDELTPVDDESKDMLADAKKGRSRNFVMVCRGADICSLIVFKRGTVDQRAKEAKKRAGGAGVVYAGVIDGRGENLNFKLNKADYSKAPAKTATLKSFLAEHADFKGRPVFELVDSLAPVLDEDHPLVQRYVALEKTALQACDDHPEQASEINRLCAEAGRLLGSESFDDALARVESLERLLTTLTVGKAEAPASGTSESPPPPPPDSVGAKILSTLGMQVKKGLPFAAMIGPQMKALAEQIRTQVAGGQHKEAVATLQQLSELIAQAGTSALSGDRKDEFLARVTGLKGELDRLKAASGDDAKVRASEFGTLLRQAVGLSQKGNWDEAFALLDRAAAMSRSIEETSAEGSTADDPLVIWREAKDDADSQLNKLTSALFQSGDDYLIKIAEGGLQGFVEGPTRAFVTLQASLMDFNRSSGDAREKVRGNVLKAVAGYREFLGGNEFIDVCDTNELCGPLTIGKTLSDALTRIERVVSAK